MNQETTTIVVPFHGDELLCVETPEGVFVPITPICERLGLSASTQRGKLNRGEKRWRPVLMNLPSARGEQETLCLPLPKLAAWLFSVNASKVKPELREAVEWYQDEAAEILDRHFRLKAAEKDAQIEEMARTLWHAHQQLRIDNPKWARVFTMMEIGESDYLIAQRCNWSMDRERSEVAAMRRCGMSATWRRDMATLAEQNLNLRWEMDRRERQEDLFGDAADV